MCLLLSLLGEDGMRFTLKGTAPVLQPAVSFPSLLMKDVRLSEQRAYRR